MENIQVGLRFLPLSKIPEQSQNNESIGWKIENDSVCQLHELQDASVRASPCKTPYNFENIFGMGSSTVDIYNSMVRKVLHGAMEGINGTIMAYGMTGSGKTFTLLGNKAAFHSGTKKNPEDHLSKETKTNAEEQPLAEPMSIEKEGTPHFENEGGSSDEKGLLSLALNELYSLLKDKKEQKDFLVKCSYLEVYSDRVYDLLRPEEKIIEPLIITEDYRKEFMVKGASEEIISTCEEAHELIQKGEKHRHYASTTLNHASSRSHTIFQLIIHSFSKERNFSTESIIVFLPSSFQTRFSQCRTSWTWLARSDF